VFTDFSFKARDELASEVIHEFYETVVYLVKDCPAATLTSV
jgi:hypothetical protein